MVLTSELLHPISLTVLGQNIFWIDHDQQIIEMANKITGSDRRRVQARMPLLTKLLAVNNVDPEQYLNHPCANKNGGCSHLCILIEGNKRRCGCPLHLVLSSDRATCVDIPVCPDDKFRCLSGATCFPLSWRCDGVTECDDMSDEMNCGICKPHQFRCQNGDCIDAKYKCDGTLHCKDHSDEQCCQNDSFFCTSYECISTSQICDAKKDCSDGSDESDSNCASVTSHRQTSVSPKHNYIIPVVVVFVFACIFILVTWRAKWWHRWIGGKEVVNREEDLHDVMLPNDHFSSLSSYPQRDVAVSSFQGSSLGFPGSLPPSSSSMYDRNHVTGASSSSSSTYPLDPINPPPSPVTERSQNFHSHCSLSSYKHYRSRNKPPPPTPCSTDVCDASSDMYSSGMEFYDSEPFIHHPPPPTPRSPCLSDENYKTMCQYPYAPPPSPVPSNM